MRVAQARKIGEADWAFTWNHADHLQSATRLTDSDGAEVRRLTYAAFGEEAENSGSVDAPTYTYTGKEQDASGLMYYGARYYDPALARFITPDTLYDADPQGLNRYSYCSNNPLKHIDPDGHEKIIVTGSETSSPRYKYNFIEPSIKAIKDQTSNSDETVTWIISEHGYSKNDIKHFKKVGKELGAEVIIVDNKEKLITHVNKGKDGNRQDDKITSFTPFSHGGNTEGNSGLWLAYGQDKETRKKTDILEEDIQKVDPTAFDSPDSKFYSCNTGTDGEESFAQKWVNQVGGETQAADGRTDYKYMNEGQNVWDRFNRNIYPGYGYNTEGAYYYPEPTAEGVHWEHFSPSNSDIDNDKEEYEGG
ncbi:MAG: RHS repeat-associated core domain-containing protein [Deltaproteobacteria bacterium]|nr:RHS repeat-associated core domain-containing protein [Deltaproteobacteria bacterium]